MESPRRSHTSSRSAVAFGIAVGVAAAVFVGWVVATAGDPREGRSALADLDVAVGMRGDQLPQPDWIAKSTSIDVRNDERREGLLLRHRVLELMSVAFPPPRVRPAGSTLVFTDAPELQSKVNDVLERRIPVAPRTEATFAIGRLVHATLVRLDGDGRVASIDTVNVSFVRLTHEMPDADGGPIR
jgi:hypothetical protein